MGVEKRVARGGLDEEVGLTAFALAPLEACGRVTDTGWKKMVQGKNWQSVFEYANV